MTLLKIFLSLAAMILDINLQMTIQQDIGLKSLTISVVVVLGIRVTRVQLMALYIFFLSKKSMIALMVSYLIISQVLLKNLAL